MRKENFTELLYRTLWLLIYALIWDYPLQKGGDGGVGTMIFLVLGTLEV